MIHTTIHTSRDKLTAEVHVHEGGPVVWLTLACAKGGELVIFGDVSKADAMRRAAEAINEAFGEPMPVAEAAE